MPYAVRCRRADQSVIMIDSVIQQADLCGWSLSFRLDTLPAAGQTYIIVCNGIYGDSVSKNKLYLAYMNVAGVFKLRSSYWDAGGAVPFNLDVTITLTRGRWYSVAVRNEENSSGPMRLYLAAREFYGTPGDSAYTLIGSSTSPAPDVPSSAASNIVFGGQSTVSGYTDCADVSVCEFAVYPGNPPDLADLNSRLGLRLVGNEADLEGYWPMDDGPFNRSTGTVFDRYMATSNPGGLDGGLRNGASWTDGPTDLYYQTGYVTTGLIGFPSWTRRPGTILTGTPSNSAFPLSNLINPKQGLYTICSSIVFDFGAPVPIQVFSARNYTSTNSRVLVKIQFNDTSSFASPAQSFPVTWFSGELNVVLPRPLHYRYARLLATNLTLGTADFWPGWEMLSCPDMTDVASISDPSEAVVMPDGTRVTRALASSLNLAQLAMSEMPRRHAMRLRELFREAGAGAPFWVCPDVRRWLYGGSRYCYTTSPPAERWSDGATTYVDAGGLGTVEDRA